MDGETMLETILLNLPAIFMLLVFVGLIVFIVLYLKAFYATRANKQRAALEQRARHNGESLLEWTGDRIEGEPDAEFGELICVIPKRRGDGGAFFYEKGLVLCDRRLSYADIKDIVCVDAVDDDEIKLRDAIRDTGTLWIYPKQGRIIGIRGLVYILDNETMNKIARGLGFAVSD